MYRVRNLIEGGESFTHISLSIDSNITKIHMCILQGLLDNIMPNYFGPASIQPQPSSKYNSG